MFQSTLPTRGSDVGACLCHWMENVFQSTLPTRGSDLSLTLTTFNTIRSFNPRSPRGGATLCYFMHFNYSIVSIHAPHEGERLPKKQHHGRVYAFQSTLPTRGSDDCPSAISDSTKSFQSTLPTRGSDDLVVRAISDYKAFQSTLPTRGSDETCRKVAAAVGRVSIHAPHEGERQYILKFVIDYSTFQSTLPTRGSDLLALFSLMRFEYVSIHAPHEGERPAEKCICMQHFREFTEYYPLRHGDACCIAPQDCIIQAFFGAKKRCFYVRLCFALKNKGVRG